MSTMMVAVKASGRAACACCGGPMTKGERAARVRSGVIHERCLRFLSRRDAAAALKITLAQWDRLVREKGVTPDGHAQNPVYKTHPPMQLYSRATIARLRRTSLAREMAATSAARGVDTGEVRPSARLVDYTPPKPKPVVAEQELEVEDREMERLAIAADGAPDSGTRERLLDARDRIRLRQAMRRARTWTSPG